VAADFNVVANFKEAQFYQKRSRPG